jgi:hypothetical protein
VGKQGHVNNHFLVGHLIAFRRLDHSVQDEDFAVGRGLEEEDVLEIRAGVEEHFFHLEGEALA